ncbi:natriuretic peptide C [Sarotherodon galilaeus]
MVTAFSVQGSSGGSSWWQKSVVFEAGQSYLNCAAFFMFEELRPEVEEKGPKLNSHVVKGEARKKTDMLSASLPPKTMA